MTHKALRTIFLLKADPTFQKGTSMDENLANNLMFVADAVIDAELDEVSVEIINASLILSHYAWNNEISENTFRPGYYKKKLKKIEKFYPQLWNQLVRNNSEELIDILKERKKFFYPNDNRLIRNFFINILGTVSVEEDNEERTIHIER